MVCNEQRLIEILAHLHLLSPTPRSLSFPLMISAKVLLCKDCDRAKPPVPKNTLFCPLCKDKGNNKTDKGQGKYKNKNHAKG